MAELWSSTSEVLRKYFNIFLEILHDQGVTKVLYEKVCMLAVLRVNGGRKILPGKLEGSIKQGWGLELNSRTYSKHSSYGFISQDGPPRFLVRF